MFLSCVLYLAMGGRIGMNVLALHKTIAVPMSAGYALLLAQCLCGVSWLQDWLFCQLLQHAHFYLELFNML